MLGRGGVIEAEGQLCFLAVLVFVFTCSAVVLTVLCGPELKAKPHSYNDQGKLLFFHLLLKRHGNAGVL